MRNRRLKYSLFGVLAAVMVATRRIDWYSVMGSREVAAHA